MFLVFFKTVVGESQMNLRIVMLLLVSVIGVQAHAAFRVRCVLAGYQHFGGDYILEMDDDRRFKIAFPDEGESAVSTLDLLAKEKQPPELAGAITDENGNWYEAVSFSNGDTFWSYVYLPSNIGTQTHFNITVASIFDADAMSDFQYACTPEN